jgi:CHAD domain-containing protein
VSAAAQPVPEPPADEDLRALLAVHLDELERRRRAILDGDDPDDLRRIRVAARRIRSLLRAARPLLDPTWAEPLRAELGWLGSVVGPTRDLDVLLAHVRDVSVHFEPGEQFTLARAIHRLDEERREAYAETLDALAGERCEQLVLRLRLELPAPRVRACTLTTGALAAAEFRRLRKGVRRLGGVATDDQLHDLRIRVKRARYAAELAERRVGKGAARFVARAKVVQDVLGEHQDACVAEARIRLLLGGPQGQRWAVAAGRLIERQAVRREWARAAFTPAWTALEREGRSVWSNGRP